MEVNGYRQLLVANILQNIFFYVDGSHWLPEMNPEI